MHKRAVLTAMCIAAGCIVASAQTATLSKTDKEFMKTAAEANMTEAHFGQMAQEHSSNDAVKDFGRTLVQDHTKAYEELTALAGKTGETIPKGIDIRRNRVAEELMHMKGPAFDRRFARYAVEDHEKAIAVFKRETEKGENADVKAYAQKMIPTLEDHLHKAQDLEKSGSKK